MVRRKDNVSRDEFVARWYAHHMPKIIAQVNEGAANNRRFTSSYVVSLFDNIVSGLPEDNQPLDGMAVMLTDREVARPNNGRRFTPGDSFVQLAEPFWSWQTQEYVVLDPSDRLPLTPHTFGPPFPTTRSGFIKVTRLLITHNENGDWTRLKQHWLDTRLPCLRDKILSVGGFGLLANISLYPEDNRYAGAEEYYFHNLSQWQRFVEINGVNGDELLRDQGCYLTSTEFVALFAA